MGSHIEFPRWQSRRTCTHLLLRELQKYNSLLNNHRQENVGSHQKKDASRPRAKEKSQQDGRTGEIAFRIKSHTHQRCSEGSNKTLCAPHKETQQRQSLNVSSRGTGQQWMLQGQGSGCSRPWVWHKPSWRRSPLTPPQSRQNLHRTGETDSWRAQTEPCVHQGERRPRRKEQWPHKRLTQTCLWVWKSPRGGVVGRGLLQGCRHWVWQFMHGTFWGKWPLSSWPPP